MFKLIVHSIYVFAQYATEHFLMNNFTTKLISVLKSNPDIEKDFNWLKTALYSDIDITHIDEDKCDEINKRLEIFYCEQAAMTSGMEPDSEAEKAPFSVDFHMVNSIWILSLTLSAFSDCFSVLISNNRFYMTKDLHIQHIVWCRNEININMPIHIFCVLTSNQNTVL